MTILMIRPIRFAYNEQTAVNNTFQNLNTDFAAVQQQALEEFDNFVQELLDHDIDVQVIEDEPEPHTPDSIFPNNWGSYHEDGTMVLYPMYAVNRRAERRPEIIEAIKKRYLVKKTIDLSFHEKRQRFLEGTGSMVLDRLNRVAYACVSPRTDAMLFASWCKVMQYCPVLFRALDKSGIPIYHSNVMMCVADSYAVVNVESIVADDRKRVTDELRSAGKEIIAIDQDQMGHFAGNMLQVVNTKGKRYLLMSSQAWQSLRAGQQKKLKRYNDIIHVPLDVIESNGGGSARCMMAEIYLEKR